MNKESVTVPSKLGFAYQIAPAHKDGFNVSQGGINPMPGATGGFASVGEARLAIRVLEHVGGEKNGQRFWDLWYRVSGVTERNRQADHERSAKLGMKIIRTGRHTSTWIPA